MTPQKVLLYKDRTTNKGLVIFVGLKEKNKNLTIFYIKFF